jgi:hypothetical protein
MQAPEGQCPPPLEEQQPPQVVSLQGGKIEGIVFEHVKVFELVPTCEHRMRTRMDSRFPVVN